MTDKTAIIYARVSSAKQAEEELPISSQLEQCQRKAEELEANVIKVFTDEGISGRSDSRPAFQDAILLCETDPPTYIITWSSSRFARNKVDAGFYKKRISESGVKLVYVSMEVDTDTTGGWLLDGVMEIFDELYSRQVSADTRRSLLKNAKEGFWNGGRLPYGFVAVQDKENPKRKRLAPNLIEAETVKKIFELKAYENLGAKSICIWLEDRGHKNRSVKWSRTTIHNLLRNEVVIGKSVFGRRDSNRKIRPRDEWIIVDSHDPIIDLQTWELVQLKMDAESNPSENGAHNSSHVFTGLLKCAECGAPMYTESAKGRKKRYWYYNCSATAGKNRAHKPRRLPSRYIDEWLLKKVCTHVFSISNLTEIINQLNEAVSSWQNDRNTKLVSAESRLQAIKQKQENLYNLLELHGLDAPDLGDISDRLKSNKEKMKTIEQEISIISTEKQPALQKVSEITIQEIGDFLINVIVQTKDPKKVRAFLGSFIDHVTVRDHDVRITYNPGKLVNHTIEVVPSNVVWLPEQGLLRKKSIKFKLPPRLHKKAV